ncbi:uncharacterized protein LOC142538524 [Primulina tabacum]|uniref:uncharacterized protein LOC142538524 n=1 Tax=Primulina tabacum TaxID=48773 RepID=UPI003F5986FA
MAEGILLFKRMSHRWIIANEWNRTIVIPFLEANYDIRSVKEAVAHMSELKLCRRLLLVNQGKTCAFLAHIGSAASSPHTMCERRAENLMRPSQHTDKVMHAQSKEEKEKNRLRLSTSIVAAFAKVNIEIDEVVLENAPKNAQYIAPEIQKEILHIMANRVRQMVREEVGDKYFCILVDEARDISKREQMAIILRFVNNHGILTERFFAIKSVSDTTSMNLKNMISNVLVHHDLYVKKIRVQGYDGASNMRGAWNGLQALFLKDCPYAYYVHCFAHRLQLTLVSAAKDVSVIWEFFSHLDNIVNIVTSSTKRIAELRTAQRNEIEYMLSIGERDSGSGANQIAIDFILMELNTRFNESSVELLSLSTALDPKNSFDSFNSDDICKLAKKFYPGDFTDQEIVALVV